MKTFINPEVGRQRMLNGPHIGLRSGGFNNPPKPTKHVTRETIKVPKELKKKETTLTPFKPSPNLCWKKYNELPEHEEGGRICPICGKSVEFPEGSIDHIVPRSVAKGDIGALKALDNPSNLRFVHKRCNSVKSDRSEGDYV